MRILIIVAAAGAMAAGCSNSTSTMNLEGGMPGPPTPPRELDELDRLVGTWSARAEMISPSPEEMAAMMPEGASMPTAFEGGGRWEPVLGGMFLQWTGWHEGPGGERMNFVEFLTWDPARGVYRSWHFNDWGEFGEGTMKPRLDGRVYETTGRWHDTSGGSSHGRGSMEFINDDLIQWHYKGTGPQGRLEFTGTSRRDP